MKRINVEQINELLNHVLNADGYPSITIADEERLNVIVNNAVGERNKAILAVLITLCVKKVISPEQDIRQHQAGLRGGFSGRTMDAKTVTPFLKENNFPAMTSGSGWLTRSFEQKAPYDFNYPGQFKPKEIKMPFLELINNIQKEDKGVRLASFYLYYIFMKLKEFRERDKSLILPRPKNKSVADAVNLVEGLWTQKNLADASRIPVLGVYAAYQCLVKEVKRYKNYELLPLLAHNAPDDKTKRAGDIDLIEDSKLIEGVEIKHGIQIDIGMVRDVVEKIKRTTIKRYYVLSTNDVLKDNKEVTDLLINTRYNHGCEIIPNGINGTLKYYLRLVSNTDNFIENFVNLLETDIDIGYNTKKAWEEQTNSGEVLK